MDLNYSLSIEKFFLERDLIKEEKLLNHLKNLYKVDIDYQLVHNESSMGRANLSINKNLPPIFVNKETDLYGNLFFYIKLIKNAREIHCLDSSFLHLVERVSTEAKLFYHNLKNESKTGANVYLIKNWERVNY